jgi:DNA-binding PadR family transcriptional regulator
MVQGLVRVHILHAAEAGPVSGVELSSQFAAAGHRLGPGTLYPLLHGMEKAGWLKSKARTVKGKHRRYYRLTNKGRSALTEARTVLHPWLASLAGLGIGQWASGSAVADEVSKAAAVSDRTDSATDPNPRSSIPNPASEASAVSDRTDGATDLNPQSPIPNPASEAS